jgi:atypical dual specificity phosphatase
VGDDFRILIFANDLSLVQVRGVVNLCQEYRGPVWKYRRLGMKELYLPTVDHFEPTVEDLESAVQFIERYQGTGKRVYIHCRAGHGRSAAVVLAWLMSKDPSIDAETLNRELCQIRNVRSTLWKQTNIKEFHSRLMENSKRQ